MSIIVISIIDVTYLALMCVASTVITTTGAQGSSRTIVRLNTSRINISLKFFSAALLCPYSQSGLMQ